MILDSFDLKDNLAIVTGGAGLLGTKHVEALIEVNSEVVVIDINQDALDNIKKYIFEKYNKQILVLKVDITKEDEIKIAKEKIYGYITIYNQT